MPDSQPILEVHDLHVHFKMLAGVVRAVDGVDFTVERGRCLGIVGESGCGKSVTARSILRLLPSSDTSGQILYHPDGDGQPIDLVSLDAKGDAIRAIRGKDIAMIFQEPMTSLTPVYTIGEQIMESIRQHQNLTEDEAQERAIYMLNKVGMPDAERRFGDYPHQMSGGMKQRIGGAIAIGAPWEAVTEAPASGYATTDGALEHGAATPGLERWYRYGFFSHLLEPKDETYVIRTAEGRYAKLRILSYYCPQATPGCVTLVYGFQGDGSRRLTG